MADLTELLNYIPVAFTSYDEWIAVGMALKHEGYDVSVWDEWSRNDSRYKEGTCARRWNTFQEGTSSIVTGGTIYDMAVKNGYKPRETTVFDWDDYIEYDGDDSNRVISDTAWLDSTFIEEPTDNGFDGLDELRRYLQALFKPDDCVGFVVDSMEDDGKYKPASKGCYGYTCEQLLERIRKESKKDKDICNVIGDYNHAAGAWIRFNPLDGQGVANANITDYRYALVESDSMEVEKQKALMEQLQLPIALMVSSGGKSIHAIVRIKAVNENDYKEKVDYLYAVCEKNGLKIDRANKNPSRLSRLPGVYRGEKKQFIIAENIGMQSFEEWQSYIEDAIDNLPDIANFEEISKNLPPLAPELIAGILRKGHKMILSGASKAGKSFLLIELAACIANGTRWLGHECEKGKVLYINLEVDGASFYHRLDAVYNRIGAKDRSNIDVWNLRGENAVVNVLAPRLIRRAKTKGYSAIIFDPLYKMNEGDENSASEMGKFFRQLDMICSKLGVSVICCHHHSKGAQGGKFAMDRSSGSGVFARDPDAILDMIQIDPRDVELSLEDGQTAWRISYNLREFASPECTDVIFEYPYHFITDQLKEAGPLYGADADTKRERGRHSQSITKQDRIDRLLQFIDNWPEYRMEGQGMYPKVDDAVDYFISDKGFSKANIKRWASDEDAEFEIVRGCLLKK